MQAETLNIQKFDIETAMDKQWDDLTSLWQASFAEREPNDPVPPKAVMRRDIEVEMESKRSQFDIYLVYDELQENAIASYNIYRMTPKADDYESKKHLAFFNIFVLQDYRRQGIGTQLLYLIAKELADDKRTVMESWVSTKVDDAFMEAQTAQVALQMKANRLHLSELDWEMVEQWAQEGEVRNPDTQLLIIDTLPEAHMLQGFADLLMHIFEQMPKENAEGFPEVITIDSIRERFEQLTKQNYTTITALTIEADGSITAMTDIEYQPERSHLIEQGLTGVHLDARGRGLGKWLKAAILLELRKRYPTAKYIDTYNANVNAPMLYINEKLGFKFHQQNTTYKLQVVDVLKK